MVDKLCFIGNMYFSQIQYSGLQGQCQFFCRPWVRDYSTYHGLLQLLNGYCSMDDLHLVLSDIEKTNV